MNKIDFLIEIRRHFIAQVCNYGLRPVLTKEKWKELVYKCLCAGITEKQIEELKGLGFSEEEIRDKLNIGKDCGICIKGDKDD